MIEKWDITIPVLTGDEVRSAYICLPETYTHDINRRFPVLYMFDGHNLFFDTHATYGKSWGLKEYMEYTHTPLIIVGIECNHSPDDCRNIPLMTLLYQKKVRLPVKAKSPWTG